MTPTVTRGSETLRLVLSETIEYMAWLHCVNVTLFNVMENASSDGFEYVFFFVANGEKFSCKVCQDGAVMRSALRSDYIVRLDRIIRESIFAAFARAFPETVEGLWEGGDC